MRTDDFTLVDEDGRACAPPSSDSDEDMTTVAGDSGGADALTGADVRALAAAVRSLVPAVHGLAPPAVRPRVLARRIARPAKRARPSGRPSTAPALRPRHLATRFVTIWTVLAVISVLVVHELALYSRLNPPLTLTAPVDPAPFEEPPTVTVVHTVTETVLVEATPATVVVTAAQTAPTATPHSTARLRAWLEEKAARAANKVQAAQAWAERIVAPPPARMEPTATPSNVECADGESCIHAAMIDDASADKEGHTTKQPPQAGLKSAIFSVRARLHELAQSVRNAVPLQPFSNVMMVASPEENAPLDGDDPKSQTAPTAKQRVSEWFTNKWRSLQAMRT